MTTKPDPDFSQLAYFSFKKSNTGLHQSMTAVSPSHSELSAVKQNLAVLGQAPLQVAGKSFQNSHELYEKLNRGGRRKSIPQKVNRKSSLSVTNSICKEQRENDFKKSVLDIQSVID
jgi:hypothetical protein